MSAKISPKLLFLILLGFSGPYESLSFPLKSVLFQLTLLVAAQSLPDANSSGLTVFFYSLL